jgi:pyruvate/2-oxoglutarate dehydrogenase complex dihydrolipoamide acyltransferase (E2) component
LISEVTMPSMGADMTEGTIAKWLKAEGESVNRGDKLAEIETDKTVVEMEAYAEGLLRKIVVPEGTLVEVGTVIAFIGDAGDQIPEVA